MKKPNFSAAFKTWAAVLFCTFFAFFTLVSAQSNTSKKLQQIREFRTGCLELLNAFPPVSEIEASSAISPKGKEKVVSLIAIVDKGSRIEDNILETAFSRLKTDFEEAVASLEAFLAGTSPAAKANDAPNPQTPAGEQKCLDDCDKAYQFKIMFCYGKKGDEKINCVGIAGGSYFRCIRKCSPY